MILPDQSCRKFQSKLEIKIKSRDSLLSSANARLRQAKTLAKSIEEIIDEMQHSGIIPQDIQNLRDEAEAMIQCVHEFSAYYNTLETD